MKTFAAPGTPSAQRSVSKSAFAATAASPVWKSKFYGAFALNHRVVLHAIDACLLYTSDAADE